MKKLIIHDKWKNVTTDMLRLLERKYQKRDKWKMLAMVLVFISYLIFAVVIIAQMINKK